MAEAVVLPNLGATVESAVILAWRVRLGDVVRAGDVLCEVETDKATIEVESAVDGLLLAKLVDEGDEAAALSEIAIVGAASESVGAIGRMPPKPVVAQGGREKRNLVAGGAGEAQTSEEREGGMRISPRARNLARRKGVDYVELQGSGPAGRIIERDIEAAIGRRRKVTPLAKAMLDSGDYALAPGRPADGLVRKADLAPVERESEVEAIPLTSLRKTIARRMRQSLQNAAQLTLHASADARALQAYRQRLKASDESLGLRGVTINDLLMFAVARALTALPELNATFENDTIYQHARVHLSMAVDTERGLLAPVIRNADSLSLRQLAMEGRRLAEACRAGTARPDELRGGTFTVSNLGALGIERFTPLLNPPQVAILGVGSVDLKPLQAGEAVEFAPHIGLSLTIDHQVVDGAGGARFLARLRKNLERIDALVAT